MDLKNKKFKEMRIIKFKGKYFNENLKKIIVGCVIVGILIFISLNIEVEYRYFLTMIFVFACVMGVFYLNRFELLHLTVTGNVVEFEYFNKSFFKKKPYSATVEFLVASEKDNKIIISSADKTICIIREIDCRKQDWQYLQKIFATG